MKRLLTFVALCALVTSSVAAQNQKLTSKMLFHNGPVLTRIQHAYLIWYGCWTSNCGNQDYAQTMSTVQDLLLNIGNTPYAQINSTYTDASGQPAASAFIFGGSVMAPS